MTPFESALSADFADKLEIRIWVKTLTNLERRSDARGNGIETFL